MSYGANMHGLKKKNRLGKIWRLQSPQRAARNFTSQILRPSGVEASEDQHQEGRPFRMYSSIALLAMTACGLANIPVTPPWERDYSTARQIGGKTQKPLVVFFGSGSMTWRQLTREGKPDADVVKLLSEQYVRLYVNGETAEGRNLARAFGLSGPRGLVISDRSGHLQAFRFDGDLAAQDLARCLARYGKPDHVVSTTEGNVAPPAP